MPVDLEVFLSATRPNLYSYSHFVDDRFSLTSNYDDRDYRSNISLPKNNFYLKSNPRRFGFIQDRSVFAYDEPKSKSRKDSKVELPRKKKVSFADDKGLNLVQVREIPGCPKWADQVLTLLTSASKHHLVQGKEWRAAFQHPPWKNETLVQRLEQKMVVLESIFVKKVRNGALEGTVKVKNLAYEKNIFVRITFDRWLSYSDIKANYVKPRIKSSRPDCFDTFSFSAKIEPAALKYEVIEFCVCFQCNGAEYWDNNGGINYRLVADSLNEASAPVHRYQSENLSDNQITLSLTENIENFSEIDAWSNFLCNQPYW